MVELRHEPENKYDYFAIAVYFNNQKIGFLPAFENIALANLKDAQYRLNGIITQHQANNDIYSRLAVRVTLLLPNPALQQKITLLPPPADEVNDIYRQWQHF